MPCRLGGVEAGGPDDGDLLQLTNLSYEFFLASQLQGVLLTLTFKGFSDLSVNLIPDSLVLHLHILDLLSSSFTLIVDHLHDFFLHFEIFLLLCS